MFSSIIAAFEHLMPPPLARRFLSGAGWSLAGSVLTQAITLLTMVLLARMLGRESYGQFMIIQTTLNTFGIFAGFGIGTTASRYAAALKSNDKERLGRILALCEKIVFIFGLVASTLLIISSPVLATNILSRPELSPPLSIAAFAVFFSTIDGYQKSTLIGFESMRAYAFSAVTGVIASMPILLVGGKLLGVYGVAGGLVITTGIQAGISRLQVISELRSVGVSLISKECIKEWIILRDFALPALLAGGLVTPAHWVCQAMLTNTPGGYAEVALLGVAMQWFNAILFLPMVTGRVVAPMLTASVVENDHKNSKRILILSVSANALMIIPIAGFLITLSPWILSLYGNDFHDGSNLLKLTVAAASIVAIQSPVGNLVAAKSRMWQGVFMNLGWAIVFILSSSIFLSNGATGVITGLVIGYIVHTVWTIAFAYFHTRY